MNCRQPIFFPKVKKGGENGNETGLTPLFLVDK
jgi:hypothetical protein